MPGANPTPTSGPGRILGGRYRLVRSIARGGMAEVWEGFDEVLRRPVAVKVLRGELAGDAVFLERFRREAVTAARLSHPAVVATYDTGLDSRTAYIVMELVRGRNLRQQLAKSGRLPPWRAVGVARQVSDALAYAHQAGLVHRDVKPANILLTDTPEGLWTVKVTDFGIAKAGDGGSDLTRTGLVLGTPKYLSPEQVKGVESDHRADLYSLGVVLFEMLAGRPPFVGDTDMAVAMAHVNARIPPLTSLVAGIPSRLEALVVDLLAKDPARRVQSAAELSRRLDALGSLGGPPGLTSARPRQSSLTHPVKTSRLPPAISDPVATAATGSLGERASYRGSTSDKPLPPTIVGPPPPAPGKLTELPAPFAARGGSDRAGNFGSRLEPQMVNADPTNAIAPGSGLEDRSNAADPAPGASLRSGSLQPSSSATTSAAAASTTSRLDATLSNRGRSGPRGSTGRPARGVGRGERKLTLAVLALVLVAAAVGFELLQGPHDPKRPALTPVAMRSAAVYMVDDRSPDDPAGAQNVLSSKGGYWETDRYATAHFGNLYDGIGLELGLASPAAVHRVDVTSSTSGWAAAIYLSTVAVPSGQPVSSWGAPVATMLNIPAGTVTFDLGGRRAAYVLVFITDLGPPPHQVRIDRIRVF